MLVRTYAFFFIRITIISIVSFSKFSFAKPTLPPQNYVETIRSTDFYSNKINDLFLSTLAKEYKSYALFKANFTPDYEMANHFAIKAINAYHGEYVKPENIYKRNLPQRSIVEISYYYNDLLHFLNTDLIHKYPQLMAEAQAKFDCWVDSESNGLSLKQSAVCQNRFMKARNHLFTKLNDSCKCKKGKENKKEILKRNISKYNGQILSIPKWPNVPVIANNPPIPVIKHSIVKELTVSKEIKDTISKISQSIKDIDIKLNSNNQTKDDIDSIKQQINELKNILNNSSQKDFVELQQKLLELENKISNISCTNIIKTEEIKNIEENSNLKANDIPENIIKEDDILIYDTEEDNSEEEYEKLEENEEYFEEEEEDEEEDDDEENEDENESELEISDEDEYIEVEIPNTTSNLLPYEIFFNWNDANVDSKFNNKLKEISKNSIKSNEIIIIKGHTDASGSPEYNQKLSKKRAENVGKIIMSYGVPREKIILQGVGSSEPKIKTKNGEKKAENRRVVIK